ncbi:MAG: hypothetical protein ACRBEE_12365 [Arenicella sp.]
MNIVFIDFTKSKEVLPFIREAMKGYSEEEIQEAQEQYALFLNTLQEIHNEEKEREKIEKLNSPEDSD